VAIAVVVAGGVFALVHAVGGASAAPLTGCEVTSTPSLTDRAFNQAVYDGLTDAATKWGIGVRDAVTSSASVREWTRHMNTFIRQRCGLIVTFGSFVGPRAVALAKANPQQRFAIADAADVHGTPNLLSIEFSPDQAAFLAGYLSAGLSKTHRVGTFGGIPLPTVTRYMDGFAAGVFYYNRVHGTHVRVIGWDPETHGMFVSTDPTDFSAFTDTRAASDLTNRLIRSDGADVIFPVDGPAGEAGACSAAQHARGVLLIGVDTDQHYSTPDCEARWVTSAMKVYRRMVFLAMGQIVHHQFKGGLLDGTLENGGVGLAPFYGFETRIPPRLRRELDRVKKGIENRSITVDPRSYLSG
jgi:basic membrane protein A